MISSKAALAFSFLFVVLASFFYYPKWKNIGTESTISWDVSGYYWYLPATFIYNDLRHLSFSNDVIKKYQCTPDFQQAYQLPNSNYVLKYSSGMAVQYLPFFLAAHLLAEPLGYAPDGFSIPYQLAIHLGGLFMCLLGLFFLRQVLRAYFSDNVVAAVLLCYVFATNYLNFTAIDMPQTHNWLFAWYAILLYATDRFYKIPSLSRALGIGVVVGICTLTRPTDIVSALIPVFWGMPSLRPYVIRERLRFIQQHLSMYAVAFLAIVLIGSIQLFYWKYVAGQWFVYSYGDQSFSWLKPHVYYYMLSARTGWLVYTPIMLFALLGLVQLYRTNINFLALFLFILINTYIVTAWDIWWYGGRAMIQSYPILAFPLAAFITAATRHPVKKTVLYSLFILFAYYNIWWTHQIHLGRLGDPYNMTRGYFWAILGRYKVSEETQKLLDTHNIYTGARKDVQEVFFTNFDNDTTLAKTGRQFNGTPCEFITEGKEYTQIFKIPMQNGAAKWLRLSADFHCEMKEWETWRMPQFCVLFKNGDKDVRGGSIRLHRFLNNGATRNLYIDFKLPQKTFDAVSLYVWNPGSEQTLLIDNMRAEIYNEE